VIGVEISQRILEGVLVSVGGYGFCIGDCFEVEVVADATCDAIGVKTD